MALSDVGKGFDGGVFKDVKVRLVLDETIGDSMFESCREVESVAVKSRR